MHRFGFALAFLFAGLGSVAVAEDVEWLTSYPDALAKAKEQAKAVLVSFSVEGGEAGEGCAKLKADVFDTDEFKQWAARKLVLVALDPEGSPELVKQFQIKAYPAVIIVGADGKETGRTGLIKDATAKKWIDNIDSKVVVKAEVGGWITSYDDAIKRAKKEKKLILADFTGSNWCGWCKKLKAEVFETQEFKEWAAANVVLLELDFPRPSEQPQELQDQNKKLQQEFAINGFPTILFLDGKGKKKGQMGYMAGGPSVWLKDASKIAGDKKLPKKPAPAGG